MKIYNALYKLSYKLKQKGLFYELKSHIKEEHYIKLLDKYERGIGKTRTLMQLSQRYKYPVLEPNEGLKLMFKREYPKAFVVSPSDIMTRGIRHNMTLLVDEKHLLPKDCNKYIDDNFKQIGFISSLY